MHGTPLFCLISVLAVSLTPKRVVSQLLAYVVDPVVLLESFMMGFVVRRRLSRVLGPGERVRAIAGWNLLL
ncbi:MAG: hypothetical protein ACP5JG_11460 [Anaerolineae bacterium]